MTNKWVFGTVWVVLSAIGEWLAALLAPHLYVFMASSQAVDGDHAMAFILYVLVPIFVFVSLMVIMPLLKSLSRRSNGERNSPQFKFNKAYVSIWIALSLAVNLVLFIHPTASAEQKYLNESRQYSNSSNVLIVDVVARQWKWIYSYPQYGIKQAVTKGGHSVLVLPKNRPVKFVLRSYDPQHTYDVRADVIHSFWIPAFGIKTDVIPGETRYEYIRPTKITSTKQNSMVRVQCAEVCGPGHPFMETSMKVVSKQDFAKWVKMEKNMSGMAMGM